MPLRVDFGEPHPQVVLAPGADGAEVIGAEGNIASGELGGPSLGNDVPLALAPQNTSEAIGMELVRADDARTRIRIEVRRTEVDAVAMPEQS